MFHYAHPEGHRLIICDTCGQMGPADFVLDEYAFMDEHRRRHQEEAVKSTPVQAEQDTTLTGMPEAPKNSPGTQPATDLPRLSGHRCRCAACKRTFSGLTTFDAHRYWGENDTRHCYNDDELANRKSPITRRANGVYAGPPMTDEQKRQAGWS